MYKCKSPSPASPAKPIAQAPSPAQGRPWCAASRSALARAQGCAWLYAPPLCSHSPAPVPALPLSRLPWLALVVSRVLGSVLLGLSGLVLLHL